MDILEVCLLYTSEATVYLATSPKSNSAYEGINSALELVRQTGNLPVPLDVYKRQSFSCSVHRLMRSSSG